MCLQNSSFKNRCLDRNLTFLDEKKIYIYLPKYKESVRGILRSKIPDFAYYTAAD